MNLGGVEARHASTPDRTGRADGNERLTAGTGAVLLVLFAVEGFTILAIHRMLTLHFFAGMLLIGPAVLKTFSTCYRFARYYLGDRAYRRKGAPAPLLRLLGPIVVLSTLGVLGSGVALAFAGPGNRTWLFLHKASFVFWFCVMTVHVLAYVPRLPRLLSADLPGRAASRARERLAGRGMRWSLLALSLVAGLMLAAATVHRVAGWNGPLLGG
jgi:hypothetical protein